MPTLTKLKNKTKKWKKILKNKSSKPAQKQALRIHDVVGRSELLTAFAKSLNYNGVKIFTAYEVKKAVRDFLAVNSH